MSADNAEGRNYENRSNVVDVQNKVQNATGTFTLTVHDKEFPMEGYSSKEAALLQQQINGIIADMENSQLTELLSTREQQVAEVAAFAKQKLDGKVFGGINAGDNQIAVSVLRPGHVRADPSTGDPVNDWYFDPGSTGWNDWIGDGSGNDFVCPEDLVVVIFAIVDQDTATEISAINVESFGRNMDMLPQDLNQMRLRDNDNEQQVESLPTLVLEENDSAHVRLRHDRDTESQPRFFGLAFGVGSYMNQEDYS